MADKDLYTSTDDPIKTDAFDVEPFSMEDNYLYHCANEPVNEKAGIKPKSCEFHPFNKFPELVDTCQEDKYHHYDSHHPLNTLRNQMILLVPPLQ